MSSHEQSWSLFRESVSRLQSDTSITSEFPISGRVGNGRVEASVTSNTSPLNICQPCLHTTLYTDSVQAPPATPTTDTLATLKRQLRSLSLVNYCLLQLASLVQFLLTN